VLDPAHERGHAQLVGPAHVPEHADRLARLPAVGGKVLGDQVALGEHVVVEEEHERRGGRPPARVAGRGGAGTGRLQARAAVGAARREEVERPELRLRRVRDDDRLEVARRGGLAREPVEHAGQQLRAAERRDDDAELGHRA
jgi:hypothetical protein